jgi:NADPH:quinone reductase-like Zn-dependent oxidoreductase
MTPPTRTALRRDNGSLARVIEPIPVTGPTDALIRVKAVALNWKDAAILNTKFPWPDVLPTGIHGSELAGEIVSVGDRVTSFKA